MEKRQTLTKNMVEWFLNLNKIKFLFKYMFPLSEISKSTLIRIYKRYLSGEFNDLSQLKTAGEKRSCNLKKLSFEKKYIATEFELNTCIRLSDIFEKMRELNRNGSYSRFTICIIAIKNGYTRKFLTLVPLNRNSNDNKNVKLNTPVPQFQLMIAR
ncbi:hypothetical protein DMUE_1493 [Dictyocoela muelleri]|nr:hypothetical protein DMUE_1493 [Dictyocoela muelleri]